MKVFLEKYNSLKYLIYFFIAYMIGFMILENQEFSNMIITDTWIDQYIPFNEYFVIPYVSWFVFMVLGFAYFVFIDQAGIKRTYFYLFLGMSLSLFVYALIPTGQNLRVELYNENIFQCLVSFIYSVDSSTNVCPSIHVYNSVMMCISLLKSQKINQMKWLSLLIIILTILICMSTMMIKQHAFLDCVWALVLAFLIYYAGKRIYNY